MLQASKNAKQSMEASKGLFVSEAKIIGHMRELQQIQARSEVQPPVARSVYLFFVLHSNSGMGGNFVSSLCGVKGSWVKYIYHLVLINLIM